MKHRTAARIVTWALVATAACGHDATGPSAPTCSSALASQLTLAVGAYASIDPASDGGCVTFPANTSVDSAEYLLVAQSAAGTFGQTAPFSLRTATLKATATPLAQRLVEPASPRAAATLFDGMLRARGRAHRFPAATARRAPAVAASTPRASPPAVGTLRSFVVCAKLDCSQFKTVGARAQAVGAHVAIYVDTLAPAGGLTSADLDTLRQVFDTLLYPLDSANFGAVSDLDTNGVVIALMTPVVNALVTKTACTTTGYIAGFFLPDDLDQSAPLSRSNHGEIFYSIVADPAGTLSCTHTSTGVKTGTPGTFVHELQHMINFAQHVLINGGSVSEEGWLAQGLSKCAEGLARRSYLAQADTARGQLHVVALPDAHLRVAAPAGPQYLPPPLPARSDGERGERRELERDATVGVGGVWAGASGARGGGVHAVLQRQRGRRAPGSGGAAAERDQDPLKRLGRRLLDSGARRG